MRAAPLISSRRGSGFATGEITAGGTTAECFFPMGIVLQLWCPRRGVGRSLWCVCHHHVDCLVFAYFPVNVHPTVCRWDVDAENIIIRIRLNVKYLLVCGVGDNQ